jgi:hypothetical protein
MVDAFEGKVAGQRVAPPEHAVVDRVLAFDYPCDDSFDELRWYMFRNSVGDRVTPLAEGIAAIDHLGGGLANDYGTTQISHGSSVTPRVVDYET